MDEGTEIWMGIPPSMIAVAILTVVVTSARLPKALIDVPVLGINDGPTNSKIAYQ